MTSIAVTGNFIYLTGQLSTNLNPPVAFGTTSLRGISGDVFVAKVTDAGSSGAFVWATSFGGSDVDTGAGVAVQGNQVYVTGTFTSPSIAVGGTVLTRTGGVGEATAFVARFADAGSSVAPVWAQALGQPGEVSEFDSGQSLFVGAGGALYVVGQFGSGSSQTLRQDAVSLRTPGGSHELFVLKLTDTGSGAVAVWGVRGGGSSSGRRALAALRGDELYLAGSFIWPLASFGAHTLGNQSLNTPGGSGTADVYVAKLHDAGGSASFEWAVSAGGVGDDYARALTVAGSAVYVSGGFGGPGATFGGTTVAQPVTVGGTTWQGLYVARLTETGTGAGFDWVKTVTGPRYHNPSSLLVRGQQVYVAGYAQLPVTFDTLTFPVPFFPPNAPRSMSFLATLTDPRLTGTTAAAPLLPDLAAYPNPARAAATVALPAALRGAPATLRLRDALGRQVRAQALGAGAIRAELELAGLPPGFYLVEVQGAGGRAICRLVVE